MIERLVGFDTTSTKSNLALIEDVADYLRGLGIAAHKIENAEGTKANLFATIGPESEGGVCLSGHTDVVPVLGQLWDTDPFQVGRRDGRLYGRGTADMKSFIAVSLAMVPEMQRRKLIRPIHLALTYDEEIGCLGAPHLIEEFGENLPRPELVIIGEPTEMRVVTANKGIVGLNTTVTGLEAHSSLPQDGVNAIVYAGHLLRHLEDLQRKFMQHCDDAFDPPYTTVGVGTIEGGSARNIIPQKCTIRWEFRPLPDVDVDAVVAEFEAFASGTLLPEMRAVHPEAAIETECGIVVPSLSPEPDSPAEALARALTGANDTHTVSFAAEAGQYQKAGIPAVICGPGSITQAHQPNEYISLDQIAAYEAFLGRLLDHLAG